MTKPPYLSIIIPVLNEEENLPLLYSRLKQVLEKIKSDAEIIFIDDGSTDKSYSVLTGICRKDRRVQVVRFRRNFGQTAAMVAGFKQAGGKVIVTMDSDLQNDPKDIPRLLSKIGQGYDLVCGWRKNRHDQLLNRYIPSYLANLLISNFTGVQLHDYGCTLKAYKKEVVENLSLYGEMHRFIPALASWSGAKIIEIPVTHNRRRFGRSKYNMFRITKVILDLITVKFLIGYQTKPSYVFGTIGLIMLFLGFASGIVTLYEKFALQAWVHHNPMFFLMIFFSILGIQFILMGLLAELLIRIYHESRHKPPYLITEIFQQD
jgi:glycosyltransferase involved in cell wall biosynthesis